MKFAVAVLLGVTSAIRFEYLTNQEKMYISYYKDASVLSN
jgi:hypothetical protein